jgi:hypothetical protein
LSCYTVGTEPDPEPPEPHQNFHPEPEPHKNDAAPQHCLIPLKISQISIYLHFKVFNLGSKIVLQQMFSPMKNITTALGKKDECCCGGSYLTT